MNAELWIKRPCKEHGLIKPHGKADYSPPGEWCQGSEERLDPERIVALLREAFIAGHWNAADAHNISDSVAYPSEFDRWLANSGYSPIIDVLEDSK